MAWDLSYPSSHGVGDPDLVALPVGRDEVLHRGETGCVGGEGRPLAVNGQGEGPGGGDDIEVLPLLSGQPGVIPQLPGVGKGSGKLLLKGDRLPDGNGTGGSGKNIKGEFAQNGVENNISHVRGVISMARAKPMDSASSQFFIVQSDSTYLDGSYAAFGRVTEGMDVVDEIASVPTDRYDRPLEDVVIKTIRVTE